MTPVGNPYLGDWSQLARCTWSDSWHFRYTIPRWQGGSLFSTLNVNAPLGSAGTGSYRVTVSSSVPDSNPGNNTVVRSMVVDRAARSDLQLSFAGASGAIGQTVVVRVTVRNNGPDGAPLWRMSVTAPSGTTYLGCQPYSQCEAGLSLDPGRQRCCQPLVPYRQRLDRRR
jgi:hypothetical protein